MRRVWSGLAALCALVALALVLVDEDGGNRPAARPAATAPAPDEGRVLGETARGRETRAIGPTSRFDLAQGAPLKMRVPAGAVRVRATLTVGGRAPVPLSAPKRVGRAEDRVKLPVRDAAVQALDGCARARVSVTARDASGKAVAQPSLALPATAPDCARYFGRSSVWNRPIPEDAPVDKLSPTLVADLGRQVQNGYDKRFPPTINTTTYSTPVYTVPATQKRVPVRLTRGDAYNEDLQKTLDEGVPLPDSARPAAGGDSHIVVWQPATDTMWELWTAKHADGRWTAGWGGRMKGMSRSPGYFSDPSGIQPGATATSLPLLGGLITFRDLRRGEIDHALAMAVPSSRYAVWALPAQRSDGGTRSEAAIPAGARFRLDPDVDVDALGLPPFTAMLARAAQRYGIYVRDTSPVVTLYAEDPAPLGENPWAPVIKPSAPAILRAFPWDKLQVMAMDLRSYSGKRIPH